MSFAKPLILMLTMLAAPTLLLAQGRLPVRGTLDDRLAMIEDRLSAIENRIAALDEASSREKQVDRLTLESEAKLDRLEVRVIKLENRSVDSASEITGQRELVVRLRSLERQVARLRAAAIR